VQRGLLSVHPGCVLRWIVRRAERAPCLCNPQAGHALVGALMPEYDPVQKISIVPRGAAGGLTFFAPSEERLESGLYSRSYLENQMAVALGGRVAEELIFGEDDVTTGASGDFQQVRAAKNKLSIYPSIYLSIYLSIYQVRAARQRFARAGQRG
jgi:Peptidase family M41